MEMYDEPFKEDEIRDAFYVFDNNHSGGISANEVRYVLDALGEHVSDEELKRMIKMTDVNGKEDGQISLNEFA